MHSILSAFNKEFDMVVGIRHNYVRENLKITPIDEKMREYLLRWYGLVCRCPGTAPV